MESNALNRYYLIHIHRIARFSILGIMQREIEYEMTDELVLDVFESTNLGINTVKSVALFGVFLTAIVWISGKGLFSPTVGMTAGIVCGVLSIAISLLAYQGYRRDKARQLEYLSSLPNRQHSITISEEGIHIAAALGTSHYSWKHLDEFARHKTHWQLPFMKQTGMVVIPVEKTDEALCEFLIAKSREVGVKSFTVNEKYERFEDQVDS